MELEKAKTAIKDAYYEMPASWQSDLGESYPEDLFTIFDDYLRVYQGTKQPQQTEKSFELTVGKHGEEPIVFVGKIDELYLRKRNGVKSVTIGEHKTFSTKPSMDVLIMNTQKCLYAKAVQILKGVLPDKVKWDYIRSTPASFPIWLEKSQRFSDAASSKITPMSWERACASRGISDPEIIRKGDKFKANISDFFFQVVLDISPAMVDNIWQGFLYTAKQIVSCGETNKSKNLTRNCSWCAYHDICYSELTGGDTEYLIARDFTERR